MKGFLAGQRVAADRARAAAPAEELQAAGYGFYAAGILEQLAETPYEEMIDGDLVWVGTPQDVIERIEAVRELCEGLTEVSITVNAGGVEHWQSIKQQELFAKHVMPHFRAAPCAGGSGRRTRVIERVCVVGAGVIGSLYAGHLAQVAEVSVLTRREEHARALNERGLRVSGRSRPHARACGRRPTRTRCRRSTSGSWRRRRPGSRTAAAALEGRFPERR